MRSAAGLLRVRPVGRLKTAPASDDRLVMELPLLILLGAGSLALLAVLLPAAESHGLPMPEERPALEAELQRELVAGRRTQAEDLYRRLNGVDARAAARAIARKLPRC